MEQIDLTALEEAAPAVESLLSPCEKGTPLYRDSPSLAILPALVKAGATVRAFDPEGMAEAKKLMPNLAYCKDAYDCMRGADVVALITEWNEFKYLNLERLRGLLRRPLIFDGRNLWEPERMRRLGFEYYSIGRKPVLPA